MNRLGLIVFSLIVLGLFVSLQSSIVVVGDSSVVGVDPGFRVVVVESGGVGVFAFRVSYLGPGVGFFLLSVNGSGWSVYPSSFSLLSGQSGVVYVTGVEGSPGVYDSIVSVRELGSGEVVNVTARLAVASECIRGSTTGGASCL